MIFHHYDGNLRLQSLLQLHELFLILLQYYIIRIQPHDKILCCLRKGIVSCFGKIIAPCKIVNFVREIGSDRLGFICTTGIHNNDFIRKGGNTGKTASQNLLLVFDNHANTDSRHTSTPFPIRIPLSIDLIND